MAQWKRKVLHQDIRGLAGLRRPLPPTLAPLLKPQLDAVLDRLCKAFPPARACLAAAASDGGSAQLQTLASFRGRSVALAAVRDEHDGDISAELSGGVCLAALCLVEV